MTHSGTRRLQSGPLSDAVIVILLLLLSVKANDDETTFQQLITGNRSVYGGGIYQNTAGESRLALVLSGKGGDTHWDPDHVYVYDSLLSDALPGDGTYLHLTGGRPLRSTWKPLYEKLLNHSGDFQYGNNVQIAIIKQKSFTFVLLFNSYSIYAYSLNSGKMVEVSCDSCDLAPLLSVSDKEMLAYGHPVRGPRSNAPELYQILSFTFDARGTSPRAINLGPSPLREDYVKDDMLTCCKQSLDTLIGRQSPDKTDSIVTIAKPEENGQDFVPPAWTDTTFRSGFMSPKKVYVFTPNHTVLIFDRSALHDFDKPHKLETVQFKDFFRQGGGGVTPTGVTPAGGKGGGRSAEDGSHIWLIVFPIIVLIIILIGVLVYLFAVRKKSTKGKRKASGSFARKKSVPRRSSAGSPKQPSGRSLSRRFGSRKRTTPSRSAFGSPKRSTMRSGQSPVKSSKKASQTKVSRLSGGQSRKLSNAGAVLATRKTTHLATKISHK